MSFRLKTILGVGLIEAAMLLILIMTSVGYLKDSSETELVTYTQTTSKLFATSTKDAILSYDLASLNAAVEELLKNEDVVYVRIIDSGDTTLAEGGQLEAISEPFEPNRQIAEVHDDVFDASAVVSEGGAYFGQVQMGFSTKRIEAAIDQALSRTSSIALIELVLVGLFSFALGLYLTNQLKVLVSASGKVAKGNLDYKIKVKGRDEVAQVATAFNTMTGALSVAESERAVYQSELETLNNELEERVKRRTRELEKKNEELAEINEQLRSTQKQLVQSEKMASVGQLAAGVAHEINNPVGFVASNLNTMKQYGEIYQNFVRLSLDFSQEIVNCTESIEHPKAELIYRTAKEVSDLAEQEDIEFINEDMVQLLEESLDGARRVTDIVAGLKSFSRESIDERQPEDLNQAIVNTLKIANNEIKYKCEVETDFSDLPSVVCNISKINQVVLNLVVNAVHAVPQGGWVKVATGTEGDMAYFEVQDNGCGIRPENMDKLFDPFFTTKAVGEGTGLGLSLSHGIIEEHGGRIDVDSTVGEGTRFRVYLPIMREAA